MKKINVYLFILIVSIMGGFLMSREKSAVKNNISDTKRILLLGASVGKAWNLQEWPKRMQNNKYSFEMIDVYSFDKSKALEEVFMRPKRKFHLNKSYIMGFFKPAPRKPDIIIMKECAAYFPGDLGKYKELVKKWINQCKAEAIKPVLATVVPVTEAHSQEHPGRFQGILEYNDWIREYVKENGIGYLDFEAVLRISQKDRTLGPDLTSGDGLHLNKKAYDILDKTITDYLKEKSQQDIKNEN